MNTDQRHASPSTEDRVPSHLKQDDTDGGKASQHGDQNAFALLVQRYQHRVFALSVRMLQDRTYEEMADILAMPIGTIKTHLFRAKRLLKERLVALHLESTG